MQIAALYVDPNGPYPKITDDWYDQDRDARTYEGDRPVVAHPPCGPWGKLAWRCTEQDRTTAFHALAEVRRCGGVLEHPVGSGFFDEAGIPTTPWTEERQLDEYGGYTLRVAQYDMGHRAIKDTIIYICPAPGQGPVEFLPPLAMREGGDPHPVERMGKRERRFTPPAFAWWLCRVAEACAAPRPAPVNPGPVRQGGQLALW